MGWADSYIERLQAGEIVEMRPRGRSMEPKIRSGQLCTVEPIGEDGVRVGDVVLCWVNGSQYLHNVLASRGRTYSEFQIGNNKGGKNGWVAPFRIYGKLVKVED